jgi:hypothetical protein
MLISVAEKYAKRGNIKDAIIYFNDRFFASSYLSNAAVTGRGNDGHGRETAHSNQSHAG